jgi:signal transduction histidine kinase
MNLQPALKMKKIKILIVEDEVIVAMEIQSTLKNLGYSVIAIADTGEKAINKASTEKPDLILMDIRLKGDLDGIETAECIRSLLDIPVIFLTAYADEEKLERAKLALPFGYLLKPIQERDLKSTIKMAIFAAEVNAERKLAQEALKKANDELEQKVAERTKVLRQEIDERKQIETCLLIAKQDAESANLFKSEFLSNISHEIRTPMHQIMSFSKFGINKVNQGNSEKLLGYFTKINTICNNLRMLMNDLLDLSKLEAGRVDYNMQPHNLSTILENILIEFGSLTQEKGIEVVSDTITDPLVVSCDETKIIQVFRNLIANAVKFTASGNKVSMRMQSEEFPLVNGENEPVVSISISDQGIGIPEDELELVFDKYTQSSKTKTGDGGTGLGLAICKEIIKAHNGKIWAENNSEGGATFIFMLPYEQMGGRA